MHDLKLIDNSPAEHELHKAARAVHIAVDEFLDGLPNLVDARLRNSHDRLGKALDLYEGRAPGPVLALPPGQGAEQAREPGHA